MALYAWLIFVQPSNSLSIFEKLILVDNKIIIASFILGMKLSE